MMGVAACGGDTKPSKPGADSVAGKTSTPGVPAVGGTDSTVALPEGESVVDSTAKYPLKIAPRVGDVYSYRLTQRSITELDGLKATEEEVYSFTHKITGVNGDGSFTVEMRYDSIRSRKAYPAGVVDTVAHTFAYDTRGKLDTTVPNARQARAFIGQRVNLTVSKTGMVTEVSNLEPIISQIFGAMRDSIPPKAIEQIRGSIKVTMFQAVVLQMFLQNVPDTGVMLGRQWLRKDTVPVALGVGTAPSRATITYNLTEVKKTGEQLLGHVSYGLVTEFPTKKFNDASGSATLDEAVASGSGDLLVDMTTGFPVRKTTKIFEKLKMTGTLKAGPNAGKSQTLAQSKTTNTLVEMLAYKPAAGTQQ